MWMIFSVALHVFGHGRLFVMPFGFMYLCVWFVGYQLVMVVSAILSLPYGIFICACRAVPARCRACGRASWGGLGVLQPVARLTSCIFAVWCQ